MKKVKILFLIENGDTNSISEIKKMKLDFQVVEKKDDGIYKVKTEGYTHVCLLPDTFTINQEMLNYAITKLEDSDVLLPLVLVEREEKRGILNSCIWNNGLTPKIGELDYELANKQIDTTLYGAIVKVEKFNDEELYNADVKHYQNFAFFNRLTKKEGKVIGVPKIVFSTKSDVILSSVSDSEKVENYKKAREISI